MDARELILRFSQLQKNLVSRLIAERRPLDTERFSDLSSGFIEVDGVRWTYRRHGFGVAFHSTQGEVDAHVGMVAYPDAVDSWRLLLYLDSRNIDAVEFDDLVCSGDSQGALDELLDRMTAAGLLKAVLFQPHAAHRLYLPLPTLSA